MQDPGLGTLKEGGQGDLVVLDQDYFTVTPDRIRTIKPVLTIVGGRITYDGGVVSRR